MVFITLQQHYLGPTIFIYTINKNIYFRVFTQYSKNRRCWLSQLLFLGKLFFPIIPSQFSVYCFWIDKGLSQCLLFHHPLILILSTAKIIVRFKFRQPRHQPIKRPFSQLIEFEFAQLFERRPSDFKCLQHNNQHRDFRLNDADSPVGDIMTSLPWLH